MLMINRRNNMNEKLGFIGLGIMGKPMAKNLLSAGYRLVVHDIVAQPVDELAALGAERASTPADVASRADIVITMLPDGPDVEAAVLGTSGIIESATAETVLVDMSSISPTVTKRIAETLAGKGAGALDAPVSGGEPGAIAGTLAIMAGGKQELFDRLIPVFGVLGKSAVLVGGIGAGQTTKLVNQILVAIHIQAMGEAFMLASQAGVDPGKVFDAIRGGLAGSNVLNAKVPLLLERNFTPGFRISLHQKDLKNAIEAAGTLGLTLPATSMVQDMIGRLVADGSGDDDHGGIVQALEALNGCTIGG